MKDISFNNILSTFYVRLYSVRHVVKDDSDSEKGNHAATSWAIRSDYVMK